MILRPRTTKNIIQRLQRGDSINIYGHYGIGKSRLLEDIKQSELKDTLVITVSFKGYQNSYKEFCRSILLDAGFDKKSPLTLSGVINKLKSSHQKILLCIDDFQYFSENPDLDPKYDQKFIDALNSIKHTQHVSLLIVSIKPMDSFVFFIHKKAVTSILDLTIIEMPSLQFSEIKDELNRRSINNCLMRMIFKSVPLF